MNLDLELMQLINRQWTHPALGPIFLFITQLHKLWWVKWVILPGLIGAGWWRWRQRIWPVILVVGLSVGLSDWVSHNLIKPALARPRPFQTYPEQVELRLNYEPRGFSLPSNHALNSMTAAIVISGFFPPARVWLVVYSGWVGYSRVYLGVHYPSDVASGWGLGWLWGNLALMVVRRWRPGWFFKARDRRD